MDGMRSRRQRPRCPRRRKPPHYFPPRKLPTRRGRFVDHRQCALCSHRNFSSLQVSRRWYHPATIVHKNNTNSFLFLAAVTKSKCPLLLARGASSCVWLLLTII